MIPLVYLAPVDWASMRQRPQQLALRLAARFELRYVNAVGMRSAHLGDVVRVWNRAAGRQGAPAPFPVLSPRYIPLLGFKPLTRLNRSWLFDQVQASLPSHGEPWILWIGAPNLLAEALIARTQPSLVVYDCMDRYAAFHGGRTAARIDRAERTIAERADLTFASSRALAERLQRFAGNVHLAPNGVDAERFAVERTSEPPPWRKRVQGPVIGYHGVLGEWLDFPLLEWLADRRPDWSFVAIGPNATRRSRRFLARPNVHLLGPVPYQELPAHTAWFDVGIVPFAWNDVTRYVHPIKALEYLAAGLPTVSTPLADLADLAECVRFADTPQQWLAAIEDSLESSQRDGQAVQPRRAAVAGRTWDRLASFMANEIEAAMRRQSDSCSQDRLPTDARLERVA